MSSAAEEFQAMMARVSAGSDDAARELVERYGHHIRYVVRRRLNPNSGLRTFVDSEDFVQSVWGSLVRIGPRLGKIDTPDQLVALLSAVARNKVVEELRRRTKTKKHRLPVMSQDYDLHHGQPIAGAPPEATPSQFAIARERLEHLLKDAPPQSQRIVELRLEGLNYLEIAEKVGVNERTVRRTLDRLAARDAE